MPMGHLLAKLEARKVCVCIAAAAFAVALVWAAGHYSSVSAQSQPVSASSNQNFPNLVAITVDYPEEGSIFPPEITPPTFLWRDASNGVLSWTIDVAFSDGS